MLFCKIKLQQLNPVDPLNDVYRRINNQSFITATKLLIQYLRAVMFSIWLNPSTEK